MDGVMTFVTMTKPKIVGKIADIENFLQKSIQENVAFMTGWIGQYLRYLIHVYFQIPVNNQLKCFHEGEKWCD